MNPHETARGILLSLVASALFALMSGYTRWLAPPLTSLDIFAWRVLWTLPMVMLVLSRRGQLPALRLAIGELLRAPLQALLFVGMTSLLGLQFWLFLWAPLHDRALEVSLGYFLLPLSMVMLGRFYYGERLGRLQQLAVACAVAGVLHEIWMTRSLSWPALIVALGYPPYFVLRRRLHYDSLVMFTMEMLVMAPLALLALFSTGTLQATLTRPSMYLLLPVLGLLSTAALACFLRAGKLLPMSLFGILGYVEPVLLVAVAVLVLGESLSLQQLGTYVPIWLSVGFTALHSARLMRRLQARDAATRK
jgi:chloramphenicol-sensitive protein RarD